MNLQGAELLLLLESPHTDELDAKHPLAGRAGREALGYLRSNTSATDSLGALVKMNALPVAIVNVSRVPLQKRAFVRSRMVRAPQAVDWTPLAELRDHAQRPHLALSPAANAIQAQLLRDVQSRVQRIPLRPDCLVAVCGKFAQMFAVPWAVASGNVLNVPHPSYDGWGRAKPGSAGATNLSIIRKRSIELAS